MKHLLFLCLLMSCFRSVARPDEASGFSRQVAACAVISALTDRAHCYDVLSRGAGLGSPCHRPDDAASPGKWQVVMTEAPVDDTVQVVLSLVADTDGAPFGENVVFIARCRENVTEAHIVGNEYLGRDIIDMNENDKYITPRTGREPARMERWAISADAMTTSIARGAEEFLTEMARERRFTAQVPPYWTSRVPPCGMRPVTAIFDTTGMDAALSTLAQACQWGPQ